MAPPKKTTTTSRTSAGTRQRSISLSQYRVLDDPLNSPLLDDTSEAMDIDQTEPEDSRGVAHDKFQELMAAMVDTQRKRHASRKEKVHKAYTKAHADTQAAITTLFDNHAKEVANAHAAQVARLQVLVQQKTDIEKKMAEKLAGLRTEYLTNSEALRKVVEYRARELR